MTKVQIEIHDDTYTVIQKVLAVDDHGISIDIPEGSILFDNKLNLELILKAADKEDKVVHFTTKDPNGQNLLNSLSSADSGNADEDFVAKEVAITEDMQDHEEIIEDFNHADFQPKAKHKFKGLGISLKDKRSRIAKISIALILVFGIGFFAIRELLWTVPMANVKIVVNSQPLIKSIEIKVKKDVETSEEDKILKGYGIETIVTNTEKIETTGSKLVGEEAEGKVKIFNKTTSDKEFKKGHEVYSNEGDTDVRYRLNDDVTVPARTEVDNGGDITITPGEASVDVTATTIGEDQNLDSGEDLRVDDESASNFSAKVEDDIDGGKSEEVKVVAQEDLDLLATNAEKKLKELTDGVLKEQTSNSRDYIEGSILTTLLKEEYNKEVDEESDEVEITQEVSVSGLTYSKRELENLLEKLLKEFIPEGYTLSSQDKDIEVQVLGNTETTILSDTESDLQVTLKAFVIVDVKEDELKSNLTGKNLEEAQRILSGIKNIETYELNISPSIPFFQRMPQNKENIRVEIQRE